MTKENMVVGVRLAAAELSKLDSLASGWACSRSEAVRRILAFGLPLAEHGVRLNIGRALFILEHLGASIDLIMEREHGDVHEAVAQLAARRVDELHA